MVCHDYSMLVWETCLQEMCMVAYLRHLCRQSLSSSSLGLVCLERERQEKEERSKEDAGEKEDAKASDEKDAKVRGAGSTSCYGTEEDLAAAELMNVGFSFFHFVF